VVPHGRLIAFTEWGVVDKKVYVVPANGGDPLLLLSGNFNPSDPTWSPDGKSIAYSGVSIVDGPGTEVRILNLDTRRSITIPGSEHMFSSRWSPDGRYIAALSDDTLRLFLYSFETGRWKELLSPEKGVYPGWPSWSRDSRYLYVASGSIYKLGVPGGHAEVVADTDGMELTCPQFHSAWFGLTPDNRVIVMRDRGTDELYALDLAYR
jgi:WD40 repeat protein